MMRLAACFFISLCVHSFCITIRLYPFVAYNQQSASRTQEEVAQRARAERLASRQTKEQYDEKVKMYDQLLSMFGQMEGKFLNENLYLEQDARGGEWWILQPTCFCYTQPGKPELQIPDSYRCMCLATKLEMTQNGLKLKPNRKPAMMLGGTPGHWFTLLNKCCTTDEQVTAVAKYFSNSSVKSPLVRLMTAPASNINVKFCEQGHNRKTLEVMLAGLLAAGRVSLDERLAKILLPPILFFSLGKMGVADKDRYDDRSISVVVAIAKGLISSRDVAELLDPNEQIAAVRAYLDGLYERSLQRPIVVAQDTSDILSSLETKGVGACAKTDFLKSITCEVKMLENPTAAASWQQFTAALEAGPDPAVARRALPAPEATERAGSARGAPTIDDDAELIASAQESKRARPEVGAGSARAASSLIVDDVDEPITSAQESKRARV